MIRPSLGKLCALALLGGGLALWAPAQQTPAPPTPAPAPAGAQAAPDTTTDNAPDVVGTDLFVGGSGVLFSRATIDGHPLRTTDSDGLTAALRMHFTDKSAIEVEYTISVNTHNYSPYWSQNSDTNEFELNYVRNVGGFGRVRPFVLGGGGLIFFALTPNTESFFNGVSGVDQSFSQVKASFDGGAGADVRIRGRISARVQMREIAFKTPDFGIGNAQGQRFTNWSLLSEPTLGVLIHF